jgi:4-amino-4-deoxy-L-arabinose transferase-like glycosyltransferase
MFIILVPVFFLAVWAILFNRRRENGMRRAFLETSLVFFSFIAASTEIFSLFNAISPLGFVLLWSASVLILFGKFYDDVKNGAIRMSSLGREEFKAAPKLCLFLTGFIYLITLVVALASPPNTYDSMTYHMARVGHWIQNGNVDFYPTAILRQLYNPPLAEYGILHLQLLAGNDYFANLVQWFALVACGAALSLIVKACGQNAKIQAFAAFLGASLPAAIVQSTGTQNDLFVSFFVLAFFYFLTRAVESNSWRDFLWTGTALGLAILAKGTAYVFCFPVGLFFVVVHFLTLKKRAERLRFIRQVGAVLLIALAFNAAHYARNTALLGSPVSTGDEHLTNNQRSVKITLANLARNYALHLGTPSRSFNSSVENALRRAFGDELKNPDSTWSDNQFKVEFSAHEDLTGNFAHALLISLALLLVFLVRGQETKYAYGAAFAIFLGFILFSFLLKWQIWGSRLQLPAFMLGSVLTAIVAARIVPRVVPLIVVVIFIFSLPFTYHSTPRPIFEADGSFALGRPRETKYFKNLPDAEELYAGAANFIRQQPEMPEEIGLYIEFNDYEYPLWILLKDDASHKPYLRHVGVANVSPRFVGARPLPEFVISTRTGTTIENVEYEVVWSKDVVRVLRKKESGER